LKKIELLKKLILRKFLEKDNKDGGQQNNCLISSSFCVAETAFRARVAFLIFVFRFFVESS